MNADTCYYCGEILPEGYGHVCPTCEAKFNEQMRIRETIRDEYQKKTIKSNEIKIAFYKVIIAFILVLLAVSITFNIHNLNKPVENVQVGYTVDTKLDEYIQDLSVGIETDNDGYYDLRTQTIIHYDDNKISWIEINNPTLMAFKVSNDYNGGVALVDGKEVQNIINDLKNAISNLNKDDTLSKNILNNLLSRVEDYAILIQAST